MRFGTRVQPEIASTPKYGMGVDYWIGAGIGLFIGIGIGLIF